MEDKPLKPVSEQKQKRLVDKGDERRMATLV